MPVEGRNAAVASARKIKIDKVTKKRFTKGLLEERNKSTIGRFAAATGGQREEDYHETPPLLRFPWRDHLQPKAVPGHIFAPDLSPVCAKMTGTRCAMAPLDQRHANGLTTPSRRSFLSLSAAASAGLALRIVTEPMLARPRA